MVSFEPAQQKTILLKDGRPRIWSDCTQNKHILLIWIEILCDPITLLLLLLIRTEVYLSPLATSELFDFLSRYKWWQYHFSKFHCASVIINKRSRFPSLNSEAGKREDEQVFLSKLAQPECKFYFTCHYVGLGRPFLLITKKEEECGGAERRLGSHQVGAISGILLNSNYVQISML